MEKPRQQDRPSRGQRVHISESGQAESTDPFGKNRLGQRPSRTQGSLTFRSTICGMFSARVSVEWHICWLITDCWPLAGQTTANRVNRAQLRACNSNKKHEQQRARTGLVKLANRRIQPLCHLSAVWFQQLSIFLICLLHFAELYR